MPKTATLAPDNALYMARMVAKRKNPALARRERAAEMSLIPFRRLLKLETGRDEPSVDEIFVLERLYGDPTLRQRYCLYSCPYGVYGLEGVKKACAIG